MDYLETVDLLSDNNESNREDVIRLHHICIHVSRPSSDRPLSQGVDISPR